MSLKPFHIVLMSTAILLGIAMTFWGFGEYGQTENSTHLYTGIGSVVLSLFLFTYLIWFLRKMKRKGW